MDALTKSSIDVGGIFREYGQQYRQQYPMSERQHKAFYAIKSCRTATLGGHADHCDLCGHQRFFYNSCRNRHCPKCQGLKRAKWVDKLSCDLLPVQYFHVVFTIPSELNPLALANQSCIYDILFKAASETLLTLARDQKYLGSLTGVVAILHTWGQNLMHHPHLHTMVPSGGWNDGNEKWNLSREKFFIPIRVMSATFRGKFLFYFKKAWVEQRLKFTGKNQDLKVRKNFNTLIDSLYRKDWVVFTKAPFKNTSQIIKYLGRYSHRVAITNGRIKDVVENQVIFTMKDYRDGKQKELKLQSVEFIHRFMLHVLPKSFCKIRYYGLFACRIRRTVLQKCKKAIGIANAKSKFMGLSWQKQLYVLTGKDVTLCPVCKKGNMTQSFIINKLARFS